MHRKHPPGVALGAFLADTSPVISMALRALALNKQFRR
jgi:hypothetical protein